jgi:polysulfide reductase-like protein
VSEPPPPALGTPAEPAPWRRAVERARVALMRGGFEDARESYLFEPDTRYAEREPAPGQVSEANRRMRGGPAPEEVHGPIMKRPVWTWEVPTYFWFGGIAAGSSFIALACDLAGDRRSAATARRVALAAVLPAPPLLIADLGRPARFLNMLRIFKPRSPMSMGAWALTAFSALAAGSVAADVAGAPRTARAAGGANAVVGGYLGSYTGVLLASTAVPLWARSRLFLGPIFVATATATGAAVTRLTLVAGGLPEGHPTRDALATVETAAIVSELGLATINERRLGPLAGPLRHGRPGALFRLAKWSVRAGLALRLARGRFGPRAHHVASGLYLGAGLAFRFAWVEAGKASAADDRAVARRLTD